MTSISTKPRRRASSPVDLQWYLDNVIAFVLDFLLIVVVFCSIITWIMKHSKVETPRESVVSAPEDNHEPWRILGGKRQDRLETWD